MDAAVNNDPAYLPGTESAIAGGLWPWILSDITCNRFDCFRGWEKSWDKREFLEHHWLLND